MSVEQPGKGRAGRVRRWLVRLSILIALLVAAALGVPPLLPERLVGRLVAARMSASLKRDVTVEGARFDLLSGLRARGVTIRQPPGFGEGEMAVVARLSARPRLAALLGAGPHLSDVLLEGVTLHVVRNEHGEWNLPKIAAKGKLGGLAVRDATVRFSDLRAGTHQELEALSAELSPVVGGQRKLDARARLPENGELRLGGLIWVAPRTGDLDRAELSLAVRSLSLERVAAILAPHKPLPAALAAARLDADLTFEARAERAFALQGTVRVLGLPEVPEMRFAGEDRALEIHLNAAVAPGKQHVEIGAWDAPHKRAGTLVVKLDDYWVMPKIAVTLWCAADFADTRNPRKELAHRAASLHLKAAGDLDRLSVTARATLDGAASEGAAEPGPPRSPLDLQVEASISVLRLSAELTRLVLTGPGVSLTGKGAVRPVAGAEPRIDPAGKLPPMIARATLGTEIDFAKLPATRGELLGLGQAMPSAGTVKADAALALRDDAATAKSDRADGVLALAALPGQARADDWRLGLRLDAHHVRADDGFWLLSKTPFLAVLSAAVGGKPEELSFVVTGHTDLATHGGTLAELKSNLGGKGDAQLDSFRIAGAPLLSLLALLTGRPAMRELTFERVEAPFAVTKERVESDAALPYEKGALLVKGFTTLAGALDYQMTVQNPRGIGLIPSALAGYLEAGHPAILITGTSDAPRARVPLEEIARFKLTGRLPRRPER